MSISFRLRPTTLFVAGALLVPCAAFAQDSLPPIVPADNSTAPVPAPVAPAVTVPTNPQTVLDIAFTDVEITKLLSMLADQFDLPIAISGDISGRLGAINLKGKTPEQALFAVVQASQLSIQKNSDGIFIISKTTPTPLVVPAPNNFNNLPLINPATGFGPATVNNTMLPPFGGSKNPDSSTEGIMSQPDDPTLVPTGSGSDSKERNFNLTIHNVKASMMAYWIDPANHEEPIDFRISRNLDEKYTHHPLISDGITAGGRIVSSDSANGDQFTSSDGFSRPFDTQGVTPQADNPYISSSAEILRPQTFADAQFGQGGQGGQGGRGNQGGRNGRNGQNGGGTLPLPEGVTRIVAVDAQNALLVTGTPEGVGRLSAIIRFLDRPLRQVEIEAQFLSISTNDSSNFGLDFTTSRGNFNASSTGRATSTLPGGLQLGFFRGNFQAAIAASVASGKAKILTAPRVTAINNLTAQLSQQTQIPIRLNSTTTLSNNGLATQNSQNLFFITTTIGLQVTPTINGDGTVTVAMFPTLTSAGTPNSNGDQTFTTQSVQTIANVRDGETIALGGLRSTNITIDKTQIPVLGNLPILGKLFKSRSSSSIESELIIFLTARIIHRVGDDDAVGSAADLQAGLGAGATP